MRVLWFTNTPSLGANQLKSIGGGWIGSLEAELSKIPSIDLGISFRLFSEDVKPFAIGSSTYFPLILKPSKNKFRQLLSRWSHKIEGEENIDQYLDVIQQFKPDVIHIFGTESDFGSIIPRTTIPCIIHLQGNLTVINLKWFSGLTLYEILKYSNKWHLLKGYGLYHDYYLNKKAAKREREIFHNCKYFMGRTDWDRRISSVLSPDSKYYHCDEIMRPGFYLHRWQPRKETKECIIVTTIRNNVYKGLETIYEALIILEDRSLKYNIIWKIFGINDGDEISYLVGRKFKNKLENNSIRLLGSVQGNELISEMLKADLFVHPSHIDNSSNSVCEAMLLGMPVIATSTGGIPSLITDKIEGLLFQDGDPYSLAGSVKELIKDRNYAIRLGANARQRAMIRHNPNKVVEELLQIYNILLSTI